MEITFIRHGESEDNLKVKALCQLISRVGQGKLPSYEILAAAAGLLRYDVNSSLSVLGKRQALDMKMILDSNRFWLWRKLGLYNLWTILCTSSSLKIRKAGAFGSLVLYSLLYSYKFPLKRSDDSLCSSRRRLKGVEMG